MKINNHSNTSTIRAVLFDLDGTLADTASDLGNTLNQLLEENNLLPLTMATIKPAASRGSLGLLHLGFTEQAKQDGKTQQEINLYIASLRPRFLEIYAQRLYEQVALFPQAKETLQFFKENHIPWGIVTNKPEYLAKPLLGYLGIIESAHCLVYGDTTKHRKPHPQPLLYASEQLRIKPKHCLYVGDSLYDIQSAQAANMVSAMVAYSQEKSQDLDAESGWLSLPCLSQLCAWTKHLSPISKTI